MGWGRKEEVFTYPATAVMSFFGGNGRSPLFFRGKTGEAKKNYASLVFGCAFVALVTYVLRKVGGKASAHKKTRNSYIKEHFYYRAIPCKVLYKKSLR